MNGPEKLALELAEIRTALTSGRARQIRESAGLSCSEVGDAIGQRQVRGYHGANVLEVDEHGLTIQQRR